MKIKLLLLSLAIPMMAGIIGSYLMGDSVTTWFTSLNKPALSPPNWVFPIVWTTLYLLMGLSFYLVASSKTRVETLYGSAFYFIQLILNVLWSALFFMFHNTSIALIELVVLEITIVLTAYYFSKVNKTAALLLVPYILWVVVAGYLNYMIIILN